MGGEGFLRSLFALVLAVALLVVLVKLLEHL